MKTRLVSIDLLRLICAFLVVCIHCTGYVYRDAILPITKIAVPIFFMITGFFLFSKDEAQSRLRIKKSLKNISYIYVVSIFVFLVYAICNGYINNDFSAVIIGPWKIFVFITNCSSLFFPYDFHLWFLIAMIEGLILFYITRYVISKYTLLCVIISSIFIIISHIIYNIDINVLDKITFIPFSKVIFEAYPFLILGYGINKYYRKETSNLIIPIFLLSIFLTACEIFYSQEKDYYSSTLLLAVSVLLVSLNYNNNSKVISLLSSLGKEHSLFIYIFHVIAIKILQLPDNQWGG